MARMTAKEMFEELGFEFSETDKYIIYEFDGEKTGFCKTEKIFLNGFIMHGAYFDACIQQFKELGWLE